MVLFDGFKYIFGKVKKNLEVMLFVMVVLLINIKWSLNVFKNFVYLKSYIVSS